MVGCGLSEAFGHFQKEGVSIFYTLCFKKKSINSFCLFNIVTNGDRRKQFILTEQKWGRKMYVFTLSQIMVGDCTLALFTKAMSKGLVEVLQRYSE